MGQSPQGPMTASPPSYMQGLRANNPFGGGYGAPPQISNMGPNAGGANMQPTQMTNFGQPSFLPGNGMLGNAFQNTGPGAIGGPNPVEALRSIYGGGSPKMASPSPFMGFQPSFQPRMMGYGGGGKL